MTSAHHDSDQGPSLLSNAIAIIAFIVVIAIVIWGLLHLANISTSWFTSLLPHSSPTLQITAPAEAQEGSPITISWKYSGSDEGTYAFLYQCRSGVTLHDADGARILCGTIHPLVNVASSSMIVTPELTGVSSSTLPFSVVFMPAASSSKQVQGTATISLTESTATAETPVIVGSVESTTEPVAATETVKPAAVTHTTASAPAAPVYHSPADLRVRILSVSSGDLSTVQFDIANIGGSPSGSYTFTAYLPTNDGYTYFSPTQASLGAGDHIVNTLQFTQSRGGTVSIVVHPSKSSDASGNNSASQSVSAPYSYSDYQYQSNLYDSYDYAYPQYAYPSYQYPQYPSYDTSYYSGYQYGSYPNGYYTYPQDYQYPYAY